MTEAGPFGRWVGGKQKTAAAVASELPPFERYVEPMVGMGSLFWHLKPPKALLADVNPLLISAWHAIHGMPELLSARYAHFLHEDYAQCVATVNALQPTSLDAAAAFLALNRRAFNGLWRVNQKGAFNAAEDKAKRGSIGKLTPEFLFACSARLQGVDIRCASVFDILPTCGAGDLVYLDPPFFGQKDGYAAGKNAWGLDGQRALLNAACEAAGRGAEVRISNADCPEMRELYAGHAIRTIETPRSVSRVASTRGKVSELFVIVKRPPVAKVEPPPVEPPPVEPPPVEPPKPLLLPAPPPKVLTLWDAEPFRPAPPPTKKKRHL